MPRKVNQRKVIQVDGLNLKGDERHYTFQSIPAKVGLQLFHRYAQPFMSICAVIKGHFDDMEDDEDSSNLPFVLMSCVGALKPDEFEKVRDELLVGYSNSDPLEVYSAMYHALMANYGATIDPLLESLADRRADSNSSHTTTDQTQTD
jgi:hypothetical protein